MAIPRNSLGARFVKGRKSLNLIRSIGQQVGRIKTVLKVFEATAEVICSNVSVNEQCDVMCRSADWFARLTVNGIS